MPSPDVLANQHAIFRGLLQTLRPHWRRDRALPARLESVLRSNRRFGSRDRRLYRELTYTALRILPWIESRPDDEATGLIAHFAADLPATKAFRSHYAAPSPEPLDPGLLLPDWLRDECPAACEPPHREALLARASVWIRVQREDILETLRLMAGAGLPAPAASILPDAWRFPPDTPLAPTAAFQEGAFEIQDLGSQLVLAAASPARGQRWLDACAGAGGKTLQLARLLGPHGHVTAHDIRPSALDELKSRANRAGLHHVSITRRPSGSFDGVLVDAPCSGSGTWRRSPHLKWTTTPEHLAAAAVKQGALLLQYGRHVSPGGRLVYATCSLCRTENENVVAHFLDDAPDFIFEPLPQTFGLPQGTHGLALLPGNHDTDGFFVAAFRKRSGP